MRFAEDVCCCHNCEHFVQHYSYLEGRFYEVDRGYCIGHKRLRSRRATDDACEDWLAQTEEYRQRRIPNDSKTMNRQKREFYIRVQVLEDT